MCERVRVREIVCVSKNKVGCVRAGGGDSKCVCEETDPVCG